MPREPGTDDGPISCSGLDCEGSGGAIIGDVPSTGFDAWLECGDYVKVSGNVSFPCDVSVSGWASSWDRVEVVFPQQLDLMGNLANGLVVSPGNSSADPASMPNPGVVDQSQHYTFHEFFSQGSAPAGTYSVQIVVQQANAGAKPLNLTVEVGELSATNQGVCPGTATPSLAWLGSANDVVDASGYTADGYPDGGFRLSVAVDNPQSVITYLGLQVVDSAGQALPGVNWASNPANAWFLGVAAGDQWINQPGWALNAAVPGNAVLDLYATDPGGYFVPGRTVWVTAYFGNLASCYTQAGATIP